MDPAGMPDDTSTNVIVSRFKSSFEVPKPPGLAADAPWSFHVFTTPHLQIINGLAGIAGLTQARRIDSMGTSSVPMSDVTQLGANSDTRGPGYIQNGFVVAISGAVGESLSLSTFDATKHGIFAVSVTEYMRLRLVSAGVEIINTTAALYKGGLATAYRVPTNTITSDCLNLSYEVGVTAPPLGGNVGLPPWVNPQPVDVYSDVPYSVNHATQYQTSSSWEAEEGAYLIVPLDLDARFEAPHQRRVIGLNHAADMMDAPSPAFFDATWKARTAIACLGDATKSALSCDRYAVRQRIMSKADRVGVFFIGVNNASTFNVQVRWTEEIAPQKGDENGTFLLSIARPSPSFCPDALRLYQQLSRALPAGVPRSMNPNGEWWDLLVSKMRTILPVAAPIARMIHPVAGAAVDVLVKAIAKKETKEIKEETKKAVSKIKEKARQVTLPRSAPASRAPSRGK